MPAVLKIQKEHRDNSIWIVFSGDIDETADFDQPLPLQELRDAAPTEVVIVGKEVRRINSSGVKAWIKHFQGVAGLGISMRMVECSIALVEQINQIVNFNCGAAIESIYVPFSCAGCKTELVGLFPVTTLKQSLGALPVLKCTKCGGAAEFDDIEEEYFEFLNR